MSDYNNLLVLFTKLKPKPILRRYYAAIHYCC